MCIYVISKYGITDFINHCPTNTLPWHDLYLFASDFPHIIVQSIIPRCHTLNVSQQRGQKMGHFMNRNLTIIRIIETNNRVFPKWNGNSANSSNLINHWRIDWGQLKDPVSHMCLSGVMVALQSLTQEVASSNHYTVMTNIFNHWIQQIQWKHLAKLAYKTWHTLTFQFTSPTQKRFAHRNCNYSFLF